MISDLPQHRFSSFIRFTNSEWTWINSHILRHKISAKIEKVFMNKVQHKKIINFLEEPPLTSTRELKNHHKDDDSSSNFIISS